MLSLVQRLPLSCHRRFQSMKQGNGPSLSWILQNLSPRGISNSSADNRQPKYKFFPARLLAFSSVCRALCQSSDVPFSGLVSMSPFIEFPNCAAYKSGCCLEPSFILTIAPRFMLHEAIFHPGLSRKFCLKSADRVPGTWTSPTLFFSSRNSL